MGKKKELDRLIEKQADRERERVRLTKLDVNRERKRGKVVRA